MKVTVCELSNDLAAAPEHWEALAQHVRTSRSEFVLLPEMPFHPWLAGREDVDPYAWNEAIREHDRWLARVSDLGAPIVVTTKPVLDAGRRFNQGVVWERSRGERDTRHRKRYLPDEEGFWEASWYSRGGGPPVVTATRSARVGFSICTELWFMQLAREYSKQGIHLLVCPRATPHGTVDRWISAGRVAAMVSGAFCLSSNFSGGRWGGAGWIIEPECGTVVATTSPEQPFATAEIDLAVADAAKSTYPRYVVDG